MTPVQNIDRELTKIALVLHVAIMREDHARKTSLMADADPLLDRRLALRRPSEEPTANGSRS